MCLVTGESTVVYDLMKNGSTLIQWPGGVQYSLQQSQQGNEAWTEMFLLPGNPAIRGDWTSLQAGSAGSRAQDKSIRINGAKFLVTETDGQTGGRQIYDTDRQLVMGLHCDAQGHLKELRLPPGFNGIRYNYDGFVSFAHHIVGKFKLTLRDFFNRNGRLQSWIWGQRQEVYSYDTRGLLAETRSRSEAANSGSRTITYGPHDVVS